MKKLINYTVFVSIIYLFYGFRGALNEYLEFSYSRVHIVILLLIYFMSFSIATSYVGKLKINKFGLFSLMAFVLFCFLTIAWSSNVGATVQGAVGLIGVSCFGITLLGKFRDSIPALIGNSVYVYSLLTLPLYVLGSTIVVHGADLTGVMLDEPVEVAFSALTGHKNLLGNMAGIGAVIFYCFYRERKRKSHLYKFSILLLTLILAKASTSIVGVVGAICAFELAIWGTGRPKKLTVYVIIAFISSIFAFTLLSMYWVNILELLGENATLSSRTRIWELVLNIAMNSPWVGNGYAAFWADDGQAFYQASRIFFGITFRQSHNGFIDLFAQAGIIGLLLGLLLVCIGFVQSYKVGERSSNSMALWCGLVFIIINNLGEANLFIPNYFSFAYLVTCVLSTNKEIKK